MMGIKNHIEVEVELRTQCVNKQLKRMIKKCTVRTNKRKLKEAIETFVMEIN